MNSFQAETVQLISEAYADQAIERSVIKVQSSSEELISLKIGTLEAWVYEDGAGISGPKIDDRFEIYDYSDLEDLREKFLAQLAKRLNDVTRGE